ncbi:hypothetical protein Tco_0706927 [Tanacetum coccineum]|uniref:Uncharacterized protein n=1 Tax=Tanacetum coccineum TaxID=301880 RepID=A0ABQ4YAC1_9ASTR
MFYSSNPVDGVPQPQYNVTPYFSFGRHLDELHVTWAHLEKKQTRLQTNTKTLEDLCSQSLETASYAILDAVTTHQVTTSHISRQQGDLRKFSDIGAWYAIEDCAQYDKNYSNPTSAISNETIANTNSQIVRDDMVRVQGTTFEGMSEKTSESNQILSITKSKDKPKPSLIHLLELLLLFLFLIPSGGLVGIMKRQSSVISILSGNEDGCTKVKRSDENFIAIGSAEDERLIKDVNKKATGIKKDDSIKMENCSNYGVLGEYYQKARILELKRRYFEDYYSDYQYAVSIKEDTEYMCLHSPKTTKDTRPIRRIQERQYAANTFRMDDPNITMEEYIRLEEEKAHRRAIVFNDIIASDAILSCEPTVSPLNDKVDFRISFDESDDEDHTMIYDKNSFSYKIIYVDDLKTNSKNDKDKVNMPLFPSPEPSVSCIDDLDFFKDFENEFPAIVYNDALTSKSDFSTEPTLCPQHIDELDLKD